MFNKPIEKPVSPNSGKLCCRSWIECRHPSYERNLADPILYELGKLAVGAEDHGLDRREKRWMIFFIKTMYEEERSGT
jgi:hypothetical protein